MGKYSRPVDVPNSKQPTDVVDSTVCKVCRGRKYTLVASTMFNPSTTVYEKKVCTACNEKGDAPLSDDSNGRSRAGKRALSGTGYLRNNKRRRKKST